MLQRIITAIVAIILLIPVLWFSDTVIFPAAMALLIVIAMFEMFRCLGLHRSLVLTLPFYPAGAVMPFCIRYLRGNVALDYRDVALLVMALLLIYILAVVVMSRNTVNFTHAATVFASALYITFSFCGIVYLRDFDNQYIYLLVFIGSWITDTFAYFTGRLFGRHKLIPDISPKKTVEGSIGGIVFCVAAFVGYAYIIGIEYIGVIWLVLSGIVVSIVSQIGDLSMSAIKRQHDIKDFGRVFPGHGGVLDRFDSVLAVSSVMTMIFAILNIFHIL
ncbi:MAG: phosphatidate cytidylyltransferase [Eubacteriales bacterium]|nr:phosphatidate cytidylyltransferase [Eubacteriales bacterium]